MLGVIEVQILTTVKANGKAAIDAINADVARALIKDKLLRVGFEADRQMVYLTPAGELALTDADRGAKLAAAGVDLDALTERIREHAAKRDRLVTLEEYKRALLARIEADHADLYTEIKTLKKDVETDELGLEDEIRAAHGVGVLFSYGLNGIQVESGTEVVVSDEQMVINYLLAHELYTMPDVDPKTSEPKLDDNGQPKTIQLVTTKNFHRFVAAYRPQITKGFVPGVTIKPVTKIAWSKDIGDLWAQGITHSFASNEDDQS